MEGSIPMVDAKLKEAEEARAELQAKQRKAREDAADSVLVLFFMVCSYYSMRRLIRKNGGPEWAAKGFARLASSFTSFGIKQPAKELREQVQDVLAL